MASFARRLAGVVWLAAWSGVLVFQLDLWSDLGGLVDERVRWWARFGLLSGPVAGFGAGSWARDLAGWGSGRSHAELLRGFLLLPAAIVAGALLVLTWSGSDDEARAVLGAFSGYWTGFDAAIAALPLACGRPWRFLREIPPEPVDQNAGDASLDRWI